MTRGRTIGGGILLAAVLVAVPLAPGVWRRVVYTPVGIQASSMSIMVTVDGLALDLTDILVMEQRVAWLPGPDFWVPDQLCPTCRSGEHHLCFPRHLPQARCTTQSGHVVHVSADFRCLCTDSSHAQD